MGCDFFYSGTMPFEERQEQIIEFAKGYYEGDITFELTPIPEQFFTMQKGTYIPDDFLDEVESYPFNFRGIIPFDDPLLDYGQFVFDRNDKGNLVRIEALPPGFNSKDGRNENDSCCRALEPFNMILRDGGYHRQLGGFAFALLLVIIKLRWWPSFRIGDDYNICRDVENLIENTSLRRKIVDSDLDFAHCFELASTEYDRQHPPARPAIEPLAPPILSVDMAVLNLPVNELELSARASGCLAKAGIDTLRQLVRMSDREFLEMRNMGRKSVEEIREVLAAMGLTIRDE